MKISKLNEIKVEVTPYITPLDAFYYILEEAPEILRGKGKVQMYANNLVESPKGILHFIYIKSISVSQMIFFSK